jgi:cytochrome c biogenesis protein CcmG/thiol:disulfide interchange protein DsbE
MQTRIQPPSKTRRFRFKEVSRCASIASALVLIGCGPAASPAAGEANPLLGAPAPPLEAEKITGDGPSSLAEAAGKVVLLDFWSTYCTPCKKSFPRYQEVAKQFGGAMTVIAVSIDEADDKDKIAEFVQATGVKFAVVWDKNQIAVKRYNPAAMPSSFVIDKHGVVRYVHTGYGPGDENRIAAEVKALLSQ